MPKQTYELTVFNEGIVSHPDPEDIVINAATYSANLDSDAPDGTLCSKKDHAVVSYFNNPMTSIKLILDQRIGMGDVDPEYIMVYFTPALGSNYVKDEDARVGFETDFHENWDSDN
jgi:hypothetical protein